MSDLRHRTIEQLRDEIKRGQGYKENCFARAAEMEEQAAALRASAAGLRKAAWAKGQRIVWARKYLAEKEIAQLSRSGKEANRSTESLRQNGESLG